MWVHPTGIWTTCNETEAEGRKTAEPPDTAASTETWRRQARPWGLLGNWKSLWVPVRSCVEWSVKDWAAESQLCFLSWDCSEAQRNPSSRPRRQRNSQPEQAHQIDANLPFDRWIITEATELAQCLWFFTGRDTLPAFSLLYTSSQIVVTGWCKPPAE